MENEERLRQAASKLNRTLLTQAETKTEVSRLLLAGWKMLSESCPISEFPLFQNPKTKEVWSVRLQMPVQILKGEDDSHQKDKSTETTSSSEISKRIGEKLLIGWELLNEEYEGCPLMRSPDDRIWLASKDEFLPSSSNLTEPSSEENEIEDEITQRISEKLVQGWEMLNEHCPKTKICPLLRNPKTGQKWSAALNDYIIEEEREKEKNVPVTSSTTLIEDEDATSKRMAEKLLLGWEMLNEHCPITQSCPLFRDPETKRKWSPATNDYIEEFKPSKIRQQKVTTSEEVSSPSIVSGNKKESLPLKLNNAVSLQSLNQVPSETTNAKLYQPLTLTSQSLELKLKKWAEMLEFDDSFDNCARIVSLMKDTVNLLKDIKQLSSM